MFRVLRIILIAFVCLVAAGPSAPAQDNGIGGFFSHLFGAPPQDASPAATPPAATPRKPHKRARESTERVRDFVPATATRAPGAPGGEPAQIDFRIYVLGDSLATLAAEGLSDAFADKSDIAVVNRAREASGLVRDDYFDWAKSANEIATAKDKPDFVVIMLGVNDLQPLRDGSDTVDSLSERWRVLYRQRVEAVLAPFKAAHIPLAWVGLPPMRAEKFNAAAIELNEIYKQEADLGGVKYIDIWDAFSDQSGQYDAFGPNIDGQSAKLRGLDGIHFTKAGSRKVAHFLEAEIRRVLEKNNPQTEVANLPPDIEQAADDINAQIRHEMGAPKASGAALETQPKLLVGPILSLTARPLSPKGVLATRESSALADTDTAARVQRVGDPGASRAGRADDFAWPPL